MTRRRRREQTLDASEQRAAGRRERQLRSTHALESAQRLGIDHRIARDRHGEIVTAQLALLADPAGHVPDARMIEEQRLDQALQQIHEVIVTPDVRQLVRENRLDLPRAESGQGAGREQDQRMEPADRGRHLDQRGAHQPHRARDADAARQRLEARLPFRERRVGDRATQPPHQPPAAEQADREHEHAQSPRHHETWEQGGEPRGARPARDGESRGAQERRRLERLRAGASDRTLPGESRTVKDLRRGNRRGNRRGLVLDGDGGHVRRRRAQDDERSGRNQEHDEQRAARREVTQVRASARHGAIEDRETESDQTALPHEMEQRPAQRVDGRAVESERGAHDDLLCALSSMRRISSISSWVARFVASACRMSWLAEPSKARSSRSLTSWRCVCSCASAAR